MSSVSDQQSQSPRQHPMTVTRQNMLGTLSLHFEAVFLLGCPGYIHIQWVVIKNQSKRRYIYYDGVWCPSYIWWMIMVVFGNTM